MSHKRSTKGSQACKSLSFEKHMRVCHSFTFSFIHRQKLMDGATPIVVIDTDDILLSLQKATQKNRETAQREKELENNDSKITQSTRNCINGSA